MPESPAGEYRYLSVVTKNRVAYVQIDRPEVLNAMNHALRVELIEALERLGQDAGVGVVVIEGGERAFSAGQDQRESAAMSAAEADQRITDYGRLFAAVRNCLKPTIAKVRGYAAGAGFQLALHCDLRYVDTSAKLGMTELKVGSACVTGSQALSGVLPDSRIRELVLLAEWLDADRALSLGLLTEVVAPERLDERVEGIAEMLAERAPYATALTKQFWIDRSQTEFEAAVAHAHEAHGKNYAEGDLSTGAKSFLGAK